MTITINGSGTITGATTMASAVSMSGNVTLGGAAVKLLNNSGNPVVQQTGSVLQVVQGSYNPVVSTSSASYVTTNLTVSITPSSASNKILVLVSAVASISGSQGINSSGLFTIYRNSTQVSGDETLRSYNYGASGGVYMNIPIFLSYLDSPATTSSTAYTLYMKTSASTATYINNDAGTSYITVMEIAA